jgi:hypothetical protein
LAITKRGKPAAQVLPARPQSILGLHKGRGQILGDIMSPIDIEWTPGPLV